MEATKRKLPSFPPNYVTLVQLQERWMKQKEKEQQQQQQQQEKQNDDGNGQQQRTEKPQMAVSAGVASSESESIEEKKKKSRKGKYTKRKDWRKKGGGGGGETHAREQASVKEDGVLADPTVEIEGRLHEMSIDGGNEKFVKPRNVRSLNRAKNSSSGSSGGGYWLRDREGRKAQNGRTMVWVKKGDNVGGAQCSITPELS